MAPDATGPLTYKTVNDQLEVTPAYELERVFGARAARRADSHGS